MKNPPSKDDREYIMTVIPVPKRLSIHHCIHADCNGLVFATNGGRHMLGYDNHPEGHLHDQNEEWWALSCSEGHQWTMTLKQGTSCHACGSEWLKNPALAAAVKAGKS